MDTAIKFLYLSEPDMIKAGVKNMKDCVDVRSFSHIKQGRLCDGWQEPQLPWMYGYIL